MWRQSRAVLWEHGHERGLSYLCVAVHAQQAPASESESEAEAEAMVRVVPATLAELYPYPPSME